LPGKNPTEKILEGLIWAGRPDQRVFEQTEGKGFLSFWVWGGKVMEWRIFLPGARFRRHWVYKRVKRLGRRLLFLNI